MRTRQQSIEEVTDSGTWERVVTTIPSSGDPTYTVDDYDWSETVQSGDIVMNDIVTPSFKKLSSKGRIINNPMDRTLTSEGEGYLLRNLTYYFRSFNHGTHYRYDNLGQAIGYDDIAGMPGFLTCPSADVDSVKNLALAEAWAKVSEHPFQGLVFLGELRETLGTLRDLMFLCVGRWRKVGSLIRAARKSVAVSKTASELWLQYRYGLRPLFYEVLSAIDAIKAVGTTPRTTYRGFSKTVADDEVSTTSWNAGSAEYPIQVAATRRSSSEVSCRAGVLVERELQDISIPDAFGLSVDQILPTVWELIPYSFVVDWFLNTANWLQALTPRVDVSPLASWVSVVSEQLQTTEVTSFVQEGVNPGYGSGKYVCSCYGDPSNTLVKSKPRIKKTLYKERIPEMSLSPIPSFDIRLSVGKVADLLALIRVLFN
jgi:hypothetical protein